MLDSDLAELYGIEVKVLKQAVKRNIDRFPEDFMFQPDSRELAGIRSQIVTLGNLSHYFRYPPFVFTENGVAMLSSVIQSKKAIEVNIAIMRIFTKMRSFLILESELKKEIHELRDDTGKMFQIVFERLDNLEEKPIPTTRKKIGL